ncbi:Serine/threonine protein kinase [Metamycoplasma auris 15026]|uniref:Serine/threonine protein kinase n=1 Tax=Metamycoplasma auris 15026 TaxID=1188233 RepID=N9VC17_9BACT|nr:serine/threonine-protein kinase [Metamycoplasma auris]ENY69198.1 Serine/threonine protein kinase [Metamycoplasma auris 15026]
MLEKLDGYINVNKHFKNFFLIANTNSFLIYSCIYKKNEKKVVIKILKKNKLNNKEEIQKFKQECLFLQEIKSKNIVKIIGYFLGQDELYYAMELIEGQTLRSLIKNQNLNLFLIIKIAIEICEGLKDIHNKNIIHRDLKPSNIMIDLNQETLKIIDFSISIKEGSKISNIPNKITGSIHYLAPELILQAKTITKQVDIYAFGIILFEMINQKTPFYSNDYKEIMLCQVNKEIPKISNLENPILNKLQKIIDKCTKKNPAQRYENVNLILKDLNACLNTKN